MKLLTRGIYFVPSWTTMVSEFRSLWYPFYALNISSDVLLKAYIRTKKLNGALKEKLVGKVSCAAHPFMCFDTTNMATSNSMNSYYFVLSILRTMDTIWFTLFVFSSFAHTLTHRKRSEKKTTCVLQIEPSCFRYKVPSPSWIFYSPHCLKQGKT